MWGSGAATFCRSREEVLLGMSNSLSLLQNCELKILAYLVGLLTVIRVEFGHEQDIEVILLLKEG